MVMQSSHSTRSPVSDPGKGMPHWSQTRPAMNGVSRQQSAHRPKSLVTGALQLMHCGG